MKDGQPISKWSAGQVCSLRTLFSSFVGAALMANVAFGGFEDGSVPAMGVNQQISLDADGLAKSVDATGGVVADGDVNREATSSPRSRLLRPLDPRQRSRGDEPFRRPSIDTRKMESLWPTGLGALAIVLALVGLVAWAVRKWVPAARASDTGLLAVVARTSLSPKHSASLLKVGNRFVVVGLSGDRMTTLCDVTDEDEVAALSARLSQRGQAGKVDAFDDLLHDESSSYQEMGASSFDSDPVAASGGRRSLGDLLDRVRRLQSKL